MKLFSTAAIVSIFLITAVPLAMAASDQETEFQIEAVQAQIQAMQEQYQKQLEIKYDTPQ